MNRIDSKGSIVGDDWSGGLNDHSSSLRGAELKQNDVLENAPRFEEYQQENQTSWSELFTHYWVAFSDYLYSLWPSQSPIVPVFASSKRLDPSIYSNACRILSIPQENVGDLDFLETQYKKIIEGFEKRKMQLKGPYAAVIQDLINDNKEAYRTLVAAWK